MSSYVSYTPARNANIRKLIERELLNINNDTDYSCYCRQPDKVVSTQQGYTDSMITNNMRIAQIINSNLGGRITFGNLGNPAEFTNLGIQGQPGGLPRPPRNKF
jgi:hypothetical protein